MSSQSGIDWSKVTIEDLQRNPNKYGLPTFEQYTKQRAKWNPGTNAEDSMIVLTDGPKQFRKDLCKIHFKVHGKEMPEEQIEIALGDHGYTLADIDLENRGSRLKKDIQMMPLGGGKYDLVVNFLP